MRGRRSDSTLRVKDGELSHLRERMRSEVESSGNAKDLSYYSQHEPRFLRITERLLSLAPPPRRLLDIGSHYLHQAGLLKLAGYDVVPMDLPAFSTLPFVAQRAKRFGLEQSSVDFDKIADGSFFAGVESAFDIVLLCETMEHITFNPIRFWRRVYDLMLVDGIIYITTPNSLRLLAFLGALWRVLSFRGVGLNVREIFRHVTFGHHWKEYSASELRRYFAALSPDFVVTVSRMTYPACQNATGVARLDPTRHAIQALGNASGLFADQLEAIVRLKSRTTWSLIPPEIS